MTLLRYRKVRRSASCVLAALLLAFALLRPISAGAATQWWDTNGTVGNGLQEGNGNWSTNGGGSNLRWSTASTGTALGNWVNGNDAIFDNSGAATTALVTVNSLAMTVNSMTFNSTGYTIGPGTGALSLVGAGTITTNADAIISAALGGSVGLIKAGTFALTLSGTNTYTGATNINAGALTLNGSIAAGSTVNVATAGTLNGTGTVNGNATLTGNGIINFGSGGTIAGTLGVTGGNWNGAGSVTGLITSSSGTFTIGSGANLTANGNLNVTGGTIAAGSSTSTITGSVNYTSASNSTFGGIIAGSGKTLTLNNAAPTLTLTGANTYTGATTISAGTLQFGNGGTTGSLSTSSTITDNGNLTVNRSNAVSQGTDFSGSAISGSGSFTQAGSGTTTLTAANTYSGGTTVSAGTLLVNNTTGAGTGTGAVTVNGSGTTLGGTGTISGTVQISNTAAGAILNPGANSTTAGTLTTGALTLSSTNANTFHIDAFGTLATDWDKLTSTAAIVLGGTASTLQVNIASGLTFTAGQTYALLNGTSLTGTFNGINDNDLVTFSGYQFTADYTGTEFDLIAVPEPSTWFAAVLTLAAIGFSQRKRLRACASSAVQKHS